ncbi:MAG: M28 family peptidase [Merdibacter sp.]
MRTSTCERINKSDEQAAARCLAERISFVFKVWCADHAFLFGRKGKRDEEQDVEAAGAALLLMPLAACEQNEAQITAQGEQAELVTAYLDAVDERYAYEIAETLAYDPAYLSNELGFRTAGSDAEHAAARYIADEMEEIGLEVEQVPVTVDRWQFNDASLRLEGTDIDIMPASYATNGTDEDGITAELVDVGSGGAADYAGKDVEGKIVLAGVDQWNEAWIDQYLHEAELHGAAAIITYDTGGYATYSDEMINMQDVCAEDVMPCVSISADQYRQIAAALEEGNETATLIVDNVLQEEQGTSYNVVGRLKGRSDEQQIIVSGHYDVYFNGFQDDSCAVGLVLAMAKGMVDSGYQPENDILFIAHGAEEWGASGTQFDWTTGAWEMINTAHPEWAGKTIAMINFELPAFYDGMSQDRSAVCPSSPR